MSEQKNGFGSMEFGTENSLEVLFGSFSAPPVDLGDAGAQVAAEAAETTSNAKQEVMSETPQAQESTPQAPVQMPQAQPKATATPEAQEDPSPQSTKTTGQVIDLFGAVAEDGADALLAKLAGKSPVFEYGSIKDEINDPTLNKMALSLPMNMMGRTYGAYMQVTKLILNQPCIYLPAILQSNIKKGGWNL